VVDGLLMGEAHNMVSALDDALMLLIRALLSKTGWEKSNTQDDCRRLLHDRV